MRSAFQFFLISFFVILLTVPAFAACDPSSTVCVGMACDALGVSRMDHDRQNIIACLEDSSGSLVWKSMSKPNCRACIQIIDGGWDESPWECTPYGGGISNYAYDTDSYDPDGMRVSLDCQ